jgi:para-nitrobenzyl esterase
VAIVKTSLGRVNGVTRKGSVSFLGIPFAAPPVGPLRWQPPAPAAPWTGVLDATQYPNRAFQRPLPASLNVGEVPGKMSEDILYLNIHTPAADRRRRPVLVWIHGGGFIQGSANDFDPSKFARENDLVVVAINYRLGLLGFLDLSRFGPDYAGSASLGFQDQIAALRWVKRNIADYGGNPRNVTISGGSAGGGSVLALLGAPMAKGLFQKAIAISPSEISHQAPDVITPWAAYLKIEQRALLDQMKSLSAEELFKQQTAGGIGGLACVDGTIIVQRPDEAVRAGINPEPLIAGSTLNEGPMLTAELGENPDVLNFFVTGLATMTSGGVPARYVRYLDERMPGASAINRVNRAWYDFFRASALRPVQALSSVGINAWTYNFQVPTNHPFGPTHGSDVRFAFNLFDADHGEGVTGAFYENNEANRQMAALWSKCLARFIRSGNPNGRNLPNWPVYSAQSRTTLVLGSQATVVSNLDEDAALVAYGLQ